jgi:hypothetical protein
LGSAFLIRSKRVAASVNAAKAESSQTRTRTIATFVLCHCKSNDYRVIKIVYRSSHGEEASQLNGDLRGAYNVLACPDQNVGVKMFDAQDSVSSQSATQQINWMINAMLCMQPGKSLKWIMDKLCRPGWDPRSPPNSQRAVKIWPIQDPTETASAGYGASRTGRATDMSV